MGGTFNPVHLGHLRAAEEIRERLKLDKIVFMPAATPPHKGLTDLASFDDRLEMLRLAIEDRKPVFELSDLEGKLVPPNYTAHTLKVMTSGPNTDHHIYFIVGFDSFKNIGSWHDYRSIFTMASLAVYSRHGDEVEPSGLLETLDCTLGPGSVWAQKDSFFYRNDLLPVYFLKPSLLQISSSSIRLSLKAGQSIRYLTPEPVRQYIAARGLYLKTRDKNKA
jgi:nicotinate-nucleotide adenylyltransferase